MSSPADKLLVYTVKRAPAEVKDGSSLALQLCHNRPASTMPTFPPPLQLYHLRPWTRGALKRLSRASPGAGATLVRAEPRALIDSSRLSSADIGEASPRTV